MKKKKKNCMEFTPDGKTNIYDKKGKKVKHKIITKTIGAFPDGTGGYTISGNIPDIKQTGVNTFEFKYEVAKPNEPKT